MQLVVTTVERLSETVPPNIETDLAFLKISRHKEELRPVVTQPDTPATDLIVHIVTYRVEIALPPPDAGFSGEIRVRDPWHSDHTMTVAARGEVTPDVQVIPRQVFVSKEEASNPSYSRRVLVRTKQPSEIRDLGIVSANSSCPLSVHAVDANEPAGFRIFELRTRPGAAASLGEFLFRVLDSDDHVRATLRVVVAEDDG